MKKLLILALTTCLVIFLTPPAKAGVFDREFAVSLDTLITNNYQDVLDLWYQEGIQDNIEFSDVILPNTFNLDEGSLINDPSYLEFLDQNDLPVESNGDVFIFKKLSANEKVTFNVTVNQTGLYKIGLDYYSETTSIHEIELALKVNGSYPFYEASQLTLKTFFETTNEFNQDRYGNDIMPNATQKRMWYHDDFKDASRLYPEGLLFKLDEGVNQIEIETVNGYFLIGQIYVENQKELISYDTYIGNMVDLKHDHYIEIEAENVSLKNNVSIRYGTDRNPTNTPFGLIEARLNVLDGATFDNSGLTVYYDIEVPQTGLYYITFKAVQNKQNTRVFRTLTIDGKIPFEEAKTISFDSGSWQNYTVGDHERNYGFLLEAGTHRIGLTVNSAPYRKIYQDITKVMRGVNDLALDIKKLTGNQIDENRDWEITDYLPNLATDLNQFAEIIESDYNLYVEITENAKDSDISAGLKMAYGWLYELAAAPNSVPKNINRLIGTTASVMQRLGIILPLVIDSPLTIDKFYVHGSEAWIKPANPGFFEGIWYEIQRFFASFFSDQFGIIKEPNELNIWVNRSRQYVNLMQQMADNGFTQDTGIKVNISLMPNEDKLILATASGTQPDLAMGVAGWRPYDFAIRNSLVDLSTLDGFDELTTHMMPGAFMQLIYQDGVYGIPETQNFNVLFYRRDILNNLNLDVPDTWDDVLDMLPELQRYGMNFYSMLSSTSAFKSFGATMPFIMQHGGKIYTQDALRATLDSEEVISAMTLMSDLFTVYALPLEVGSFYNQFRYGNIPVGIGDFGMYIQLLFAAPEIAGLWDIAPLPGIELNGVVNRSYDGASTSSMIFKNSSKQLEAWEFLKWWMSTETQTLYAENLMTAFGAEYMWNTANVDAFMQMSINASHKSVFLEQWQWVLDTAKTPASYMLEREISNAWNRIVYDGVNVRVAMEDAQVVVNKEIFRKMVEFEFINTQGEVLKPYLLPTKENLDEWVIGHD
ncbi:MAG TPA: extracellular solute-binding protein [Acholeplasma sp.]|nr:extracellular solute-binding protein [Acholeplasma sp.]